MGSHAQQCRTIADLALTIPFATGNIDNLDTLYAIDNGPEKRYNANRQGRMKLSPVGTRLVQHTATIATQGGHPYAPTG